LFFDLPSDLDISFFKSIEQINDINQITEEAVLGFTLPRTPKNKRICQSFDLEALIDEPLPISVIASVNGQTIRQDRLLVLNVEDTSETYEVELYRPTDHWISQIDFPLCTLDFGEYVFTGATVAQYNQAFPYQDGGTGVAFPIANYGTFLGRSGTPNTPGKPYFVENYRPWLNPLKVLQDGFCKIGWTFESPLLETSYGRSLLTYLLSDNLILDNVNSGDIFASAEKTTFIRQSIANQVSFTDDIIWTSTPIGAGAFISNQFFATPGIFDVEINFNVSAFAGTGNVEFTLELLKSSGGSSTVVQSERAIVPVVQAGPQNSIVFTAKDVDLLNNEVLFVKITYKWNLPFIQSIPPSIAYNGTFLTRRKAGIPLQGDTVQLNKFINCDYLFIEYLKGISHLFNFKFITDWANRKVVALTVDRADVFGNTVDGYYLDTIKELKPIRASRSVLNKRNTRVRYALLEFAQTSDPGIQKLIQPNEDPLFSKRLDYGSDLEDKTVNFTNPFFEPTRNDNTTEVSFNGVPINMPYIWDNNDNKLSFKIAPRILYFIPTTQQYTGLVTGPTAVNYRGVGASASAYSWAFMIQPLSHFFILPPQRLDENVVYGDVKNDLSKYWVRDLFAKLIQKELTYTLLSTYNDYQLAQFRFLYKVFYEGREFIGRLVSIENQRTLQDLGEYTFIPEPSIPICDLLQDPDEVQICQNSVRILTEVIEEECDKCIQIVIDGSYESQLRGEVIEVSFDNGETWEFGDEPICCDQHNGEPFIVRVIVDFDDGCPQIVRSTVIDPCDVISNDYVLNCVTDENCISLEIENLDPECDTTTIYYSVNGGLENEWNGEPICVEDRQIVNWRVEIETGCCGTIELEAECFIEEEIICNPEFGVNCVFLDGNVRFVRFGEVGEVALDIIQYRCVGEAEWCNYTCNEFVTVNGCECFEVKRVLIYCNDNCPTQCYQDVCCSDEPPCEDVDAGTPENLIICN
jgi:hypothetical protein